MLVRLLTQLFGVHHNELRHFLQDAYLDDVSMALLAKLYSTDLCEDVEVRKAQRGFVGGTEGIMVRSFCQKLPPAILVEQIMRETTMRREILEHRQADIL